MHRWRKLGRLYTPRPLHDKLLTHAANPLAVHLDGDVFRIFFSGRDKQKRSSVGFVDIDIITRELVGLCDGPVFEHGGEGSYFSHGVSIGNCYEANGRRYMLFMGWHIPDGGHWRGEIGRLAMGPDMSLAIETQDPLIGLGHDTTISLSYPWVMPNEQGGFNMWFGSTETWDAGNGEMLHPIRHAHSKDGDHWGVTKHTVPFAIGTAQAFSRPTVVKDHAGYHMWFSYRSGLGETYRIGSESSSDGLACVMQKYGIDVYTDDWDSGMIEYPFVFDHAGERFMLYNGNGYGLSGFGCTGPFR